MDPADFYDAHNILNEIDGDEPVFILNESLHADIAFGRKSKRVALDQAACAEALEARKP